MKDVQCYELFGEIALKNYAFSFYSRSQIEWSDLLKCLANGSPLLLSRMLFL